jgi:uncharacterized protein (DUF2062 family)
VGLFYACGIIEPQKTVKRFRMTFLIQLAILAAVVAGISFFPNPLTFTALFASTFAIAQLGQG